MFLFKKIQVGGFLTSKIGNKINITISGSSHSEMMEAVLIGIPSGEKIDTAYIQKQMSRRAPGQDSTATSRKEPDTAEILSGIENGVTTGGEIRIVIKNTNTKSSDYDNLKYTPRPSHADYPAFVKYNGQADMRGSGHFSGRMTAPLTALGAVCRQVLKNRGIHIGGHVFNIGDRFDIAFDPVLVNEQTLDSLSEKYFATLSEDAQTDMRMVIEDAKKDGDSIGGAVEVAVTGMPVGIGNHMFGGVENIISTLIFGVPAVKGVSFGAGFDFSFLRGSEANDAYYYEKERVLTATNNCGGIAGGMTTGMPIIVKAAIKPTPTVFLPQNTVNLKTKENVLITAKGRHDPCIVPRALPAIEAAVAVAITMLLAEDDAL